MLPVAAIAQDGSMYLSPMASRIDNNVDKGYENDTGWTLGVGKEFHLNWNVEGYAQKLSPGGTAGQDQTAYGVDVQRVLGRDTRWRPYLFVGIGILDTELDSSALSDRAGTTSVGIGVLGRTFGNSLAALRAEYRYRRDDTFSGGGDDGILSFGVQIPFGRAASAPAPVVAPPVDPDEDDDGVLNAADRCLRTPPRTEVDSTGCRVIYDGDGDGVEDLVDACPDTVAGAIVGRNGCELDDDRDGVVNRLDRCPNTTAGAAVDVYGCEILDVIELPGVTFETNSNLLVPEAISVLEDAAQTLRNNPQITVEVAGHTDSQGAADYNQQLSESRAIAVRNYFVGRGLEAARLSSRGYGEEEPVADNATAQGRAMNRRVVLRILTR